MFLFVGAVFLMISTAVSGQTQAEKETEQGISQILKLGGIAQEVELTPEQHDQLFGLWLEIKFDLNKAFQNYKDSFSETLPTQKQAELKQELAEAITGIRDKEFERLEATLLSDQMDRLKQLRIQYLNRRGSGVGALKQELNLTSGQVRKIEQAAESLKKQLQEIQSRQRDEQLTRVEMIQIVKDLTAKSRKEATSCLTTAQRQTLNRLQGEEFDFKAGRRVSEQEENPESMEAETIPNPNTDKKGRRLPRFLFISGHQHHYNITITTDHSHD